MESWYQNNCIKDRYGLKFGVWYKKEQEPDSSWLDSFTNKFVLLSRVVDNTSRWNLNENMLREVIVNIGLEKIDTQKEVTIEALLDNSIIVLVISLKFARKQRFKLKKIEELIYVRNLNRTFNKKRPIENTVEVNIFYKEYKKKMEIDIIGR